MTTDGSERPAPAAAHDLLDLLELETLDVDLFRAHSPSHTAGWGRLFGGQVAAQALRAAMLTVDADRFPHSLHGYFLRPGRSDMPTIVHVDRDRDGRSVSSRRVTATQTGHVIFSMSASFQVADSGPELQPAIPDGIPEPDDAGESQLIDIYPFEIRPVSRQHPPLSLPDVYWARSAVPLPDDPLIHACMLTYLTDMGVGEGVLAPELFDTLQPSIDHAVWFHRPIRLDEWTLFAMRPLSAQGGRLLYTGVAHGGDGTLAATMIQECLVRPLPPGWSHSPG
ncbi:MAG TPA: acyl-CoA thioesterase domain-containing protein, partial [Acidimicrobiia bacterium]